MVEYHAISGYWRDNKEPFEGYIVSNYDSHDENGEYAEEDIFWYGMEEEDIQQAIEDGEDWSKEDFVITGYEKI